MKGASVVTEPSVKQVAEDSAEGVLLRRLLEEERVATVNYLKYNKKAAEWDRYRKERRAAVRRLMGSATTAKIGELVAVVSEPKDQFSGAAFREEYPTLYDQYIRVRAEEYLDVEELKTDHPDIADRFVVRTFLNRAA